MQILLLYYFITIVGSKNWGKNCTSIKFLFIARLYKYRYIHFHVSIHCFVINLSKKYYYNTNDTSVKI